MVAVMAAVVPAFISAVGTVLAAWLGSRRLASNPPGRDEETAKAPSREPARRVRRQADTPVIKRSSHG
jgi:hypothetical protein